MAYILGKVSQRPANSSCKVVSTPAMKAEDHRLRSSALVLMAVGHCSGITADMVPCERDTALEQQGIEVAGVQFMFWPCLPLPGTSRIWRYYCLVPIERLPLISSDWESVRELLGKDCELELIERKSTTKANCSALYARLWTWHPYKISRASNFTVL
ncbi:hypothetical protein D1007_23579 [Hordeum vulgare]|nr:hypothetical protein D1007_23579 [Hordeum vulgare]